MSVVEIGVRVSRGKWLIGSSVVEVVVEESTAVWTNLCVDGSSGVIKGGFFLDKVSKKKLKN